MNKILLCNDDGFGSLGINALDKVFSRKYEVWVIAPHIERSGYSHAINLFNEIILKEISEKRFMLENGFPADCANVGMHSKIFPKFDLIISGINHGANLGHDVHCSGTVAIARLAALHNIPAVAINSVNAKAGPKEFQKIAEWLLNWLEESFHNLKLSNSYNINYPHIKIDSNIKLKNKNIKNEFPPHRFCIQGRHNWKSEYREVEISKNKKIRTIKLITVPHFSEIEAGSDVEAILNNMISITPLSSFATDHIELKRWLNKK